MRCAKDIMTKDVVYLTPEDSIIDAAKFFAELNIHGVAVVEDQKLVGVLTVSDILKFIDLKIKGPMEFPFPPGLSTTVLNLVTAIVSNRKFSKELEAMSQMKVRDFMSTDPLVVRTSTSVLEVARLMNEKKFHRLPVVSRGKLVGMVTGSDLMKVLVNKDDKQAKVVKNSKKK